MSKQTLKAGKYRIVHDGGGPGKGGIGIISVNGTKVAEGKLTCTQSGIFSVDDLADVGVDESTPVADYGGSSHFNGKIDKVLIEVKK